MLEREGLVEHARRMGDLLLELTAPLVESHDIVRDVRGLGLMWAIELGPPARATSRSVFNAAERMQPGLFAQLVTVPLFHEHRIFCQVAGHRMNVVKALPGAGDLPRRTCAGSPGALTDVLDKAQRVPSAMARFGLRMARGTARSLRG